MKRFTKEPLIHFLLLGAALFGFYQLRRPSNEGAAPRRLVVTQGDLEHLSRGWQMQWGRPPAPDEWQGLIDAHVREEILSREALALGLDRDDTIIRRRLAQKFEFVTEDLFAPAEPAQEQLTTYLQQHSERYQHPARVSFSHVYFNPDRRGGRAEADAAAALQQLLASTTKNDAFELGDPFLLDHHFEDKSVQELEMQFGVEFARAVMEAEIQAWRGPISSAFGWHLVKVTARLPARAAELADVEKRVRRDWEGEQRRKANDQMFARLRARYEIVVEDGKPMVSQTASAAELDAP